MKLISTYQYIFLGTTIWYLQTVQSGSYINQDGGVRHNLDFLVESLKEHGFHVTKRASFDLEEYVKSILTDGLQDKISSEVANKIQDLATKLRPTLDAEAMGAFAYIATDKRYSVEALLSDPWRLFADNVRQKIDDVAIIDIEDAAKCVAFERPTAVAFHLMRATESVLKRFYCNQVKRNRVQLMWGPMVTHMRSKSNPPDAALLDHVHSIRRNFRNPTQHPDKIYDMTEAQDLFGVCIDVINRMTSNLPDRNI